MDNTYEYANQQQEDEQPNFPHSGVGIASFIVAAFAWIITIVMFATAWGALVESFEYFGTLDPDSPSFQDEAIAWFETYDGAEKVMGLMLIFMTAGGLCFVGLVLGIIGLFSKERKKLFPILGTVFSGVPFLFPIFGLFLGPMFL